MDPLQTEQEEVSRTQEAALDLCLSGNGKTVAQEVGIPPDDSVDHAGDTSEDDDDTSSSSGTLSEDDQDSGLGSNLSTWTPNLDTNALPDILGGRPGDLPDSTDQLMDYSNYFPDFSDMFNDNYHFWQMEGESLNSSMPNYNLPSGPGFFPLPYGPLVSGSSCPMTMSQAEEHITANVTQLPPISSVFSHLGHYGRTMEHFCEDSIPQETLSHQGTQGSTTFSTESSTCVDSSMQNHLSLEDPGIAASQQPNAISGFTHCSSSPFSSYVPQPSVSTCPPPGLSQYYHFGTSKRSKTVRDLLQERLNLAYITAGGSLPPWGLKDCLPPWPWLGEDAWTSHYRCAPWVTTEMSHPSHATLQNPTAARNVVTSSEPLVHTFHNVPEPVHVDVPLQSPRADGSNKFTNTDLPNPQAPYNTSQVIDVLSAPSVNCTSKRDHQQKPSNSPATPVEQPSTVARKSPSDHPFKPQIQVPKVPASTSSTSSLQPLKITRVIPLQQSHLPIDPAVCKVVSVLPTELHVSLARVGSVVGRPRTNVPSAAVRPCNISVANPDAPAYQVKQASSQSAILNELKKDDPVSEGPQKQTEDDAQPVPPPLKLGRVDAKEHRPRHYDMERLEIGNFVVENQITPKGKSLNKFKVIFSKRRFVYEFEVASPSQPSVSNRRPKTVACMVIPFRTVMGLKCEGSQVKVLLDTQPAIYLGLRHVRMGIIASVNVYDTAKCVDITNGAIKTCRLHQVTLRKYQADKLKVYLWHFDARFRVLTQIPLCDPGTPPSVPSSQPTGDGLVKRLACKKLTRRCNPVQWSQTPSKEDGVLSGVPQTCSCRVSCRSVRCSCTKGFRKCNAGRSVCQCTNCDNPVNTLEEFGVDLKAAAEDKCLLQNIHRFLGLRLYLTQTLQLNCCGHMAMVKECIPGTVACPNQSCKSRLEYSWCRSCAYSVVVTSRNHCDVCRKCRLSLEKHCLKCNRCFLVESKCKQCPRCNWDFDRPPNSAAEEPQGAPVLVRVQIA